MRKKKLTKAVETTIAPNPKEVDIWVDPKNDGTVSLKYYDYHADEWVGGSDSDNNDNQDDNLNSTPFNIAYVNVYAYDRNSAGAVVPNILACIDFNTKQVYYITTGHGDNLSEHYSGTVLFEEVHQTDILTMEEEHFYKVTLLDVFDKCNSSGLNFKLTAVYHSDLPDYEQSRLNYRLNTSHSEYTACEAAANSINTSYEYGTVGIEALNYVCVYLPNNDLPLRIY